MSEPTSLSFAALPAPGSSLLNGIFRCIVTLPSGGHAAAVQLPSKPAGRLDWQAAMDWAKQAGGELPSRAVYAQLYALAKSDFEPSAYWSKDELQADTGDEDDASYAWSCDFSYGRQYGDLKSFEACAVAVRLIPLTA